MVSQIPVPSETKTIKTVSEAIDALSSPSLMRDLKPEQSAKRGDADFGLWFRGHEKLAYVLVPSILRESIAQTGRYVDEFSLTRHFKAMNPDASRPDAADFDWLVTMQHYLAPTRLLDWTENLLVALYFAVRDASLDDKEDAAIWILNARRLNYYASASARTSELAFPEDPDVIARSCLCRIRERKEWHDVFKRECARIRSDREDYRQKRIADAIKSVRLTGKSVNDVGQNFEDLTSYSGTQGTATSPINLFDSEAAKTQEGVYGRLRMPVAVYASRANRRIRSQSGVFTLHGGKYVPAPQDFEPNEIYRSAIGMPISLLEINASLSGRKILKWLRIPKGKRSAFRRTLGQIGVTDATLFPELDYQSKYLLTRWTHAGPKPNDQG